MKIDNYLKGILTIIATCLLIITIELATLLPANANRNVIDVNIRQVAGSSIFRNIPVEINNR